MKTMNYPPGASMQGYATVPATSDAKEYLRLLLSHKVGLVATVLVGLGLAWLYLISTPPVYQAEALVEVNESANYLEDQGNAQIDWNAPTIREESNLLRSRRVLSPVVEQFDLNLSAEPRRVPVLADLTERLPWLASWIESLTLAKPYHWRESDIVIGELALPPELQDRSLTLTVLEDNAYRLQREERVLLESGKVGERLQIEIGDLDPVRIQVDRLEAPVGAEFSIRRSSLQAAVSALRSRLTSESTDSKSRMLTVSLRGADPAETAGITNAIVNEYKDVKLGSQNLKSDTEFEFYQTSLPEVEAELREAEAALAEYRDRAESFNQDAQVQAKLGQIDRLESELLVLELENDALGERYTSRHPSRSRLLTEISVLERKIQGVKDSIQGSPDTERELGVLEKEVDSKRALFTEMSEKLQKLRIARGGNVGSVQIIDDALAPRRPVSPDPMLAVVGATLGTLFLYILFLTLRSALSTVISDQESLERASGLPVFMNIPRSAAQRRLGGIGADARRLLPGGSSGDGDAPAVLALSKPEDYSVENLRGLRSMLEDVMASASNNVLMITSPLPSMGKSFVSLNLAVLLAQAGRRVLLIDADFQRGQLHKALSLPMGPGLPELVRGRADPKETIHASSVPNLYCIAKGFMGGNIDREMPTDKEIGTFLRQAAPRFDIVLLDTPPVLSVATPALIGKHAGSTIMVVKEGEAKEPQLLEALKRLMYSGVRVNGCILNGSSTRTPGHYTYYREQVD